VKLYNCPNRKWVIVKGSGSIDTANIKILPATLPVEKEEEIFFDHVDGMYSFCLNKEGQICYIAAWTEVEVCKEQRKLPKEKEIVEIQNKDRRV
jgi:hypothetical protein